MAPSQAVNFFDGSVMQVRTYAPRGVALWRLSKAAQPERGELPAMSASVEELKAIASPTVVDARGVSCPGPILAAKKQIGGVPVGNVMEVMATDSGTLKDIPAWCRKMGHDFLGSFEEAGSIHLFLRKAK